MRRMSSGDTRTSVTSAPHDVSASGGELAADSVALPHLAPRRSDRDGGLLGSRHTRRKRSRHLVRILIATCARLPDCRRSPWHLGRLAVEPAPRAGRSVASSCVTAARRASNGVDLVARCGEIDVGRRALDSTQNRARDPNAGDRRGRSLRSPRVRSPRFANRWLEPAAGGYLAVGESLDPPALLGGGLARAPLQSVIGRGVEFEQLAGRYLRSGSAPVSEELSTTTHAQGRHVVTLRTDRQKINRQASGGVTVRTR